MSLIVLRNSSQVFYKMFLNFDLSDGFPINLGLWILGGGVGGEGCSLVAQLVKNPPATRETWVQSLGWNIP